MIAYCGTEWLIGINFAAGRVLINSKDLGPIFRRQSFS
jgi:hypothetical protein